jgi:flagellar motor switch protein FliN/FliY
MCCSDRVATTTRRQCGSIATFVKLKDPLGVLEDVSLDISVVLGTTWMPVHQVLRLGRGAVIELEATEDDEVKILANNMPIASGVVVVNGNRIAVELKEMLPRLPDVRS